MYKKKFKIHVLEVGITPKNLNFCHDLIDTLFYPKTLHMITSETLIIRLITHNKISTAVEIVSSPK